MARPKKTEEPDQRSTGGAYVNALLAVLANEQPIVWTNQVYGRGGTVAKYGLVGDGSVAIRATKQRDAAHFSANDIVLIINSEQWEEEPALQLADAKLPDGSLLLDKIRELAKREGEYVEPAKAAKAK